MSTSDASSGSEVGGDPLEAGSVGGVSTAAAEDSTAVPTALAGLISSARHALRAVVSNPVYSPEAAVEAVEVVTAVLHRLSEHFEPYVGDYSPAGAETMGRVRESLEHARAALSEARHILSLDLVTSGDVAAARLVALVV